ncbi:MAG: MBL fold metallo-hydrolase [Thermodesulfobacteriota bacterium]|nr:MBL fold metallo-hydrolase [Thermodesulfobacteriota bacterium]
MNPPAQIIHIGGEKTVTGSCHLVKAHGLNIMVDCGIAQGSETVKDIREWPVSPSELDYLFLTHAHIDHIGRIPQLIEHGFSGEILCTHPTKALLSPMLRDAMALSGSAPDNNKKILKIIDELSWGFEYCRDFKLKKGIGFRFGRSGHILGSCFIRFEIPHNKPGTATNPFSIIFSGDLGKRDTPILPDPDPPPACDLLILESTYGDRLHEDRSDRIGRLGRILEKALADHGKVYIPAFALGRTQELLFELDRIFSRNNRHNQKRSVPVFVDSPLGLEITRIYSTLSEFWDDESNRLLSKNDHPFDFAGLYSVDRAKDHHRLCGIPGPAIIIAGSGMCTGGRIIEHLRQGLGDSRNDIFFVGYQAKGTPGRDIIRYADRANGYVILKGAITPIKAKIHTLTGYSAHADQKGLINWVKSMPQKPGRIKLVHGESKPRKTLAAELTRMGYSVDV